MESCLGGRSTTAFTIVVGKRQAGKPGSVAGYARIPFWRIANRRSTGCRQVGTARRGCFYNQFANGEPLDPASFSGGQEMNEFLRSRGFRVVDRSRMLQISLKGLFEESAPGYKRPQYSWVEGQVDTEEEHYTIQCGDINDEAFTLVARVGRGDGITFVVEFTLVAEPGDARALAMVHAVRRQLNLFYRGFQDQDPWMYGIVRCGWTSNAFGRVHWSFHQRKSQTP